MSSRVSFAFITMSGVRVEMRTSITAYVTTVVAILAARPPFATPHPGASAPAIETGSRSDAATAAAALSAFLADGEDGCTCGPDLRELVGAFQDAHDADPSGRGPPGVHPATGPVPTHGYLETSTAKALAAYSGRWFPPCYGAFNSRCGDVPAAEPLAPRPADARVSGTVQPRSTGGCLPWNFGAPDGGATCHEATWRTGAATGATDDPAMIRLRAQARAACGDSRAAQLVHDWVFDERGCPAQGRIAGCRETDRSDPRIARLEWFYDGAGRIEDVQARCGESGRTLVLP